jgi:three-Cys-motif partner protein
MATTDFFTDQTGQSRTKARIVANYFDAWSHVLGPVARKAGQTIQYVDLFAGPGRYEDGSESTPLLVLRKALANPKVHDLLVSVFNDANPANADALRQAIDQLPGIRWLKHRPRVCDTPVDEEVAEFFENKSLPPTLTFIDPFGYKGLSMRLIQAVLKDFGCDCLFFFNFNRVNAALHNEAVEGHIATMFEAGDAARLRQSLSPGLRPHEREAKVMEQLTRSIKGKYGRYVLHFSFKSGSANRTSHHLVFATKHERGCSIMKDIMARESSWAEGGVPSYVCSTTPRERTLFDALDDPLAELAKMLLEAFAGQTLRVDEVYERHGLETPYTLANYKDALKRLEEAGRVTATPPTEKRRANTMADHVVVAFPPREA